VKNWTATEIKQLRKRLKMTQREFAETTGTTQVYISYLEGGMKQPGRILKKLLECIERERKRK